MANWTEGAWNCNMQNGLLDTQYDRFINEMERKKEVEMLLDEIRENIETTIRINNR